MHGVSAYGLLVMAGRRPATVRRKLIITAVAAIAIVAIIDFDGFAHAEASGHVTTTSVSTTPTDDVSPDAPWSADESPLGTRPDAVH